MAAYLFTFHAYRSWMPGRARGYVRRGQGILPPDEQATRRYAHHAKHSQVAFDPPVQAVLVSAVREVCRQKNWRLHQVMTDGTHIHILVSWRGFMDWKKVRRSLRYRCTSELNGAFGADHPWLSEGGSRKRVRDRAHFDYLMHVYLPRHDGRYWREDGKTREQCRGKTGDQNRRL